MQTSFLFMIYKHYANVYFPLIILDSRLDIRYLLIIQLFHLD